MGIVNQIINTNFKKMKIKLKLFNLDWRWINMKD